MLWLGALRDGELVEMLKIKRSRQNVLAVLTAKPRQEVSSVLLG